LAFFAGGSPDALVASRLSRAPFACERRNPTHTETKARHVSARIECSLPRTPVATAHGEQQRAAILASLVKEQGSAVRAGVAALNNVRQFSRAWQTSGE